MTLDPSTFEYLKPTEDQMISMSELRGAAKRYANIIDAHVPDGADKTYALRKLREVAMWANVAVTRQANGAPR
jgi:hypothetical protein